MGRGQVRSDEHLLALMVQAKCFGRLGYFPRLEDVPDVVVGHIRRDLGLGEDVRAVYDSDRTRGAHRTLIRRRSEVVSDMPAARAVAAATIGEAARRKNDPADLINVALEKLVEGSFELPGYSTLDEMAARIREEVNSSVFATVAGRIGPTGVYTAYLALSLTDPALAIAPLLKDTTPLIGVIASQLRAAQEAGDTPEHLDPDAEALSLIAMSAGLGTSVITGQSTPAQAQDVIDYHLNRLFPG